MIITPADTLLLRFKMIIDDCRYAAATLSATLRLSIADGGNCFTLRYAIFFRRHGSALDAATATATFDAIAATPPLRLPRLLFFYATIYDSQASYAITLMPLIDAAIVERMANA